MEQEFIAQVYDSLLGLPDTEPIVGVEVILQEDKLYYQFYQEMMLAYGRLRQRLGIADADSDVEEMIDCLMCMARLSGYEMFRYGMRYGKMDDSTHKMTDQKLMLK